MIATNAHYNFCLTISRLALRRVSIVPYIENAGASAMGIYALTWLSCRYGASRLRFHIERWRGHDSIHNLLVRAQSPPR